MTEPRRPPMTRQHAPQSMWLPDGKTCGDCVHVGRCQAMFGHIPQDKVCDWDPSRFRPSDGGV